MVLGVFGIVTVSLRAPKNPRYFDCVISKQRKKIVGLHEREPLAIGMRRRSTGWMANGDLAVPGLAEHKVQWP